MKIALLLFGPPGLGKTQWLKKNKLYKSSLDSDLLSTDGELLTLFDKKINNNQHIIINLATLYRLNSLPYTEDLFKKMEKCGYKTIVVNFRNKEYSNETFSLELLNKYNNNRLPEIKRREYSESEFYNIKKFINTLNEFLKEKQYSNIEITPEDTIEKISNFIIDSFYTIKSKNEIGNIHEWLSGKKLLLKSLPSILIQSDNFIKYLEIQNLLKMKEKLISKFNQEYKNIYKELPEDIKLKINEKKLTSEKIALKFKNINKFYLNEKFIQLSDLSDALNNIEKQLNELEYLKFNSIQLSEIENILNFYNTQSDLFIKYLINILEFYKYKDKFYDINDNEISSPNLFEGYINE